MPKSKNLPPIPQLTIQLLGPPHIILDERPVESLRRKNRALVYYLAAQARPQSREAILTLFWPDHARAAAQPILRTMVHALRKTLGRAFWVDDESLALGAETETDLAKFTRTLASPQTDAPALAAALEFYRGDFVEGFTLADTPSFEDWVASERERLRLLFSRGLTKLAFLNEAQRDWAAALAAVERALRLDPLQEELQRAALRLQYLKGDRPGAIRRYDSFRRLLDDEMGVPPMPETRALYDAIILDALPPETAALQTTVPQTAPQVPIDVATSVPHAARPRQMLAFVGRAREMQALTAAASTGKLVLIEGNPGIGKTRLAQEFIIRFPDALVLKGAAHELETGLPYRPIIEALRGLAALPEWNLIQAKVELAPLWQAELAPLVPELFAPRTTSNGGREESRMWQALYNLVTGLAQVRRVILFLDDLQWADPSTLGWLGHLLRQPLSPRLALVATAQSARGVGTVSSFEPLLQALVREERVERITLNPLSPADVRRLAEQVAPARAEAFSEWLVRTTEGHPFFVTEMVRYTQARSPEQVEANDNAGAGPKDALPEGIHNLIAARLRRLSNPARRVLQAAAVMGREFDFALLMRVCGLDEDAVLDALDELRAYALIQPRERGGFAFDHHLTLQVVLEEMGEVRQMALHRHIAEALAEIHREHLDPVAGLIARHWAGADAPGQVAPYAFRSGQFAASVAAWTEAIAAFEQALATEPDGARRTEILLALSSARFNRGDLSPATEAARAAVALASARRDWPRLEEAHLALNITYFAQGRYPEAIADAEALRGSCPPDLRLAAEFMWGMALSLESTHPVQAEHHLRAAENLMGEPRAFASRVTPIILKYQLAGALAQQGKIDAAVALYREVLASVERGPEVLDLQRHVLVYNSLAYYLYLRGDSSAAEYARAGLVLAREKGTLTHQAYLLSTSGEIALGQKDWQAAQDFFEEGLALAQQLNIPERIAGLTANLGRVAGGRGENGLARQRLTDALAQAERLSATHLATRIRIWLAPLLPRDAARQCLSEARAAAESSGYARLLEEIAALERGGA